MRFIKIIFLCLFLDACAVGKDYKQPILPVDNTWSTIGVGKSSNIILSQTLQTDLWWKRFHDEKLSVLEEKALANNNTLKVAEARIAEARANERIAVSAFFPQITASASATRSKSGGSMGNSIDTVKQAGVNGAWSIDIFGGTRRSVEASEAEVQATEADRDNATRTLATEVARTYVQLRSLQQQRIITKRNLAMQEDTLHITKGQRKEGGVSNLEVARAQAQVDSTAARLPQIDAAISMAVHHLSVLVNEQPRMLKQILEQAEIIPDMKQEIVASTPIQAIGKRPDVHAAERRLAESTALSGAAFAQLFPSLSLQGFFGRQDSLLYGNTSPWSAAASALLPIIDFGRIRGQINVADAREQQAFFTYQQIVLLAVEETENAFSAYLNEQRRKKNLASAASEQAKATDVAREQYKAGVATQLDLLLAENSQLDAENQLVLSEAAVADDLIQLYNALGEPWQTQTTLNGGDNEKQHSKENATGTRTWGRMDRSAIAR